MAEPRHLNRAPIREGLINIQFEPVAMEAVQEFASKIASRYNNTVDLWSHAFEFEVGPGVAEAHTKKERNASGRRFDTPKDGPPHVVLIQRGYFTYSRLQPYEDWQDLRGAAKPLWELFAHIAKPPRINRVAVRYINAMALPLQPGEQFSKYLKAAPQIPPELPQAIAGFLQRIVIPDKETGNLAVVTQALEGADPSKSRDITVIFDIDVFRQTNLTAGDDDIWTILDTLRDFKNNIFFRHLTEDAMELFT